MRLIKCVVSIRSFCFFDFVDYLFEFCGCFRRGLESGVFLGGGCGLAVGVFLFYSIKSNA